MPHMVAWMISKQAEAWLPCEGKGKDLLLPSLHEPQSEDIVEGQNKSLLPR